MRCSLRRVLDPLLPAARFSPSDRRIVWVIWVAGVVQGYAQSQASAGLPFTRAGLGLSQGEMSLLLGLARLAAFAALPLGWLGDRGGRRKPFLWAMTLIILGGAGAGLVLDAWQFGLLHSVLRTGTAAVSGLAVVLLAENTSKSIRAYAISFYGAAVSLGSGVALMALPLAARGGESWRVPHLITGVSLLLLPFLIKRVPESRIFRHDPEAGRWQDLAMGAWSRRFWIVVTVNFLFSAYGAVGAAFSTERLLNHVGLTTGTTIIVLLGGGTLGGLGFFVGGHIADSWGRRKTSVLSLLLALGGGLVLYSATSLPVIGLAVVISAFGTFAFVPAGGSHRAELFPTSLRSSANTAAANFALAGSAAGLIAGIYTIDTLGLTQTIYLLGLGMAAAALLTLSLPETKGQDLAVLS